jgi:hypothetical protein
VVFEDGTVAEIRTPGFKKVLNGNTYVMFLAEGDKAKDLFTLNGGPQGVFEVPADGTGIKTFGRATDPVVQKNKDRDVKAFLKEVREDGKKWPEPSKCCK